MARWIRFTGSNAWAREHRGGDDGRGGYRFDLSPCPTVSADGGGLGGSTCWRIEEDDDPEMAETFASRRNGEPHSFDDPAPTVQKFGIADERPTSLVFGEDGAPARELDPGKPPYRVPLVSEIHALPRNGLTVMSTFSGCGGSCLGFEWAGYRPLLAVEFVPAAVETYQLNHPGVPVYTEDIRGLTAEAALELMGVEAGELDVLEGSPPCESFSTSGKLSEGWGQVRDYSDGKQQVMDDLFYEFTRLLGGIRPRAFVAENVAGLARGVSKGYFKRIHATLAEQGYRVEARMLDAQWLGVPQRRKRVIFVGIRDDVDAAIPWPSPLGYRYSIRDALAGIGRVRFENGGSFRDSSHEVDLEKPVRTILRSSHGFEVRDESDVVRVTGRTASGFGREDAPLDEPIESIVATGASQTRYEVERAPEVERLVYENGGSGGASQTGRPEEALDEPIRTITKAHGADGHFQVERATEARKVAHADTVEDNVAASLEGYAVGTEWAKLRQGQSSDRFQNLVRPRMDDPCPTVTAQGTGAISGAPGGVASVTHPEDPRKFSIAELRRLCGFPDDFVLTGSYAQQWERLGNSVPPPMMYHVAAALRDALLPTR